MGEINVYFFNRRTGGWNNFKVFELNDRQRLNSCMLS